MLSRLRAHTRAVRETPDAGVSLAEMLVAMGLGTIIGAMSLAMFVSIDTSAARTVDRTFNTAGARNTLHAWTAYLRVADGTTPGSARNRIEWLTPGDLLFYANLGNRDAGVDTTAPPTMLWLRVDSTGRLVEEHFPSDAAPGTAPTICRVLAERVASVALFRPHDGTGADLSGNNLGTAPTPSAGCRDLPVTVPSRTAMPDPVAVANLRTVASVTIDFTISETRGTRSEQFTSVATLQRLGGAS